MSKRQTTSCAAPLPKAASTSGLAAGALVARRVAKQFTNAHFGYLIVAAFMGFIDWTQGLSSSIAQFNADGIKFENGHPPPLPLRDQFRNSPSTTAREIQSKLRHLYYANRIPPVERRILDSTAPAELDLSVAAVT